MTDHAIATSSPPSFFRQLLNVLIRPRQAFAAVAGHQSRAWIVMALLGLVLVTLPAIASGPMITRQVRETFANEDFRESLSSGAQTPETTDQAANAAVFFATVFPVVGTVLSLLLGWAVWSGALHLLSSLTGGRNSFTQMLRVVIWAWIPYGLRNIVQAVYIAATGTLIENPGLSGFVNTGPPPENPLAFTPPAPSVLALNAFLERIDIYLFWDLALLVIGITAVAKLPRRKAIGIVLVVWAVFMLLRVVFAAAAGGLPGALVS